MKRLVLGWGNIAERAPWMQEGLNYRSDRFLFAFLFEGFRTDDPESRLTVRDSSESTHFQTSVSSWWTPTTGQFLYDRPSARATCQWVEYIRLYALIVMWQHGQDNLLHPIILVWFWDSFGSIGASAKCMQQRSRISTWYDGWIVFSHWSKISGFADRKMEVTPALDGNNRSAAFNGDDDRDTAGSGQSPVCSSTQRWPIGAQNPTYYEEQQWTWMLCRTAAVYRVAAGT